MKIKKIFSTLLMVFVFISAFAINIFAIEQDGTQANPWLVGPEWNESNVTAYIDSGTLYINGSGPIADFGSSAPWKTSTFTSAEIAAGISSIGSNAFKDCSSLASVYVGAATPPDLGSDVFNGCTNLAEIVVDFGSYKTYKTSWSSYEDLIVIDTRTSYELTFGFSVPTTGGCTATYADGTSITSGDLVAPGTKVIVTASPMGLKLNYYELVTTASTDYSMSSDNKSLEFIMPNYDTEVIAYATGVINDVELLFDVPKVGATEVTLPSPKVAGSGYEVDSVLLVKDGDVATEPLEEGQTYFAYITIKAVGSKSFSNSIGIKCDYEDDDAEYSYNLTSLKINGDTITSYISSEDFLTKEGYYGTKKNVIKYVVYSI